jgi:hypothetical protein
MKGDELKLHYWVGRYKCPIEQVPVHKESIVWRVVEKGIPLNLTDPRSKVIGIPWQRGSRSSLLFHSSMWIHLLKRK